MEAKEIDDYCMSFSGASRESLFGPNISCWLVSGRVFAMMADGSESISLRCPSEQAAQMLVEHGRAGWLPHLPHGGWIALKLTDGDFELKSRIRDSFDMVRAGRG